jgi:hypothetical protein
VNVVSRRFAKKQQIQMEFGHGCQRKRDCAFRRCGLISSCAPVLFDIP